MRKKLNKKGFTLAELLIVVAIIAVLTAIAIPVFTAQLEKSRQATDLANLRASYAEASVNALEDEAEGNGSDVVITCSDPFSKIDPAKVGSVDLSTNSFVTDKTYHCHVVINDDGSETVTFPETTE